MSSAKQQVQTRTKLLSKYCAELCAEPELCHGELVTAFFWPNDGTGSVVAPDGSKGTLF